MLVKLMIMKTGWICPREEGIWTASRGCMHSHRKITSHLYDLWGWGNWHEKAGVQHAVVMPAIIHCGYFFKKSKIWLLFFVGKESRKGRKKDERWCDKGGGGELDIRGGESILRWQQGAPWGPLKAASRITSSSFSHSLEAPVEGIIASLSVCRPDSEVMLW